MIEIFTRSRRKICLVLSLAVSILFITSSMLSGCTAKETTTESEKASEELVLTGSTTLLQVSEAWASAFMEKSGGTIIVNGGGSGEGIAALINGTTDLANASRQIKDEELEAAKANNLDVQEHMVLYDGIAVIVSKNVTVDEPTIEQLSKIYTGKITNWKDVGGKDSEIVLAARDSSSGTGEYFLKAVVQLSKTMKENDYSDTCLRLSSNADVVMQVSGNDNTIGYIGLGYVDISIKVVKVKVDDSSEGIAASFETVKDGSYPISRGLYIYAPGKDLTDIAQAYLDFVISDEGQAIGEEAGFVAIKSK